MKARKRVNRIHSINAGFQFKFVGNELLSQLKQFCKVIIGHGGWWRHVLNSARVFQKFHPLLKFILHLVCIVSFPV